VETGEQGGHAAAPRLDPALVETHHRLIRGELALLGDLAEEVRELGEAARELGKHLGPEDARVFVLGQAGVGEAAHGLVVVEVDQAPAHAVREEAGDEEGGVAHRAQQLRAVAARRLDRAHVEDGQGRLVVAGLAGRQLATDAAGQQVHEIELRELGRAHLLVIHRPLQLFTEELDRRLAAHEPLAHRPSLPGARRAPDMAVMQETCAHSQGASASAKAMERVELVRKSLSLAPLLRVTGDDVCRPIHDTRQFRRWSAHAPVRQRRSPC